MADVFRRHGQTYLDRHSGVIPLEHRRVMNAIALCRTAALGGHLEQCSHCGREHPCYNPCSNRHCPKCQSLARAQWIEDRKSELLDCPYFHAVFTVPEQYPRHQSDQFGSCFDRHAHAFLWRRQIQKL
jgi:hypothetical protein